MVKLTKLIALCKSKAKKDKKGWKIRSSWFRTLLVAQERLKCAAEFNAGERDEYKPRTIQSILLADYKLNTVGSRKLRPVIYLTKFKK